MGWVYFILALAVLAATFVAGALYGRKVEKQSTAYLRSILDSVDKKVE